ncbi:MAG: creatininase, partial [Rhodospirillaceae bacterium]|nr:creatininase [Rhodospirillaceae bacterium]
MKSGYWQDLTTKDFSSLEPSKTVALLPVSAVEQHGPHLPLSTDALINEGIVSGTLRALPVSSNVLVLPSLTVGSSLEHITFPGTLTVNSENLLSFWKSVGSSVCRAGIRKLVLLNSHGGNKALVDLVALQLRAEMQMLVVRANYFDFGMPKDLFKQDELRNGFHGGEVETSLIM